jgi:hypothetical protein
MKAQDNVKDARPGAHELDAETAAHLRELAGADAESSATPIRIYDVEAFADSLETEDDSDND